MVMTKHRIRGFVGVKSNDGHDAAILVIADALKQGGIEVILGGYDLTVDKFVDAIIQEGVHFAGISSYNGGHIPFFEAVRDALQRKNYPHIHLIGGGGATMTPEDIAILERQEGIDKIFRAGEGDAVLPYINEHFDFSVVPEDPESLLEGVKTGDELSLSRWIHLAEEKARLESIIEVHPSADHHEGNENRASRLHDRSGLEEMGGEREILKTIERYGKYLSALDILVRERPSWVYGITGRGGSGKSTITDELILRFFKDDRMKDKKVAVISIDPSSAGSGGALLADRIGYIYATDKNWVDTRRIFIRSVASRGYGQGIARALPDIVKILKAGGHDIFIESYGIGQPDIGVTRVADQSIFVTTPDVGGAQQIEKEDMLNIPGVIVVLNKSEHRGSRHISSLLQKKIPNERLFLTTAIEHGNPGINSLYQSLTQHFN
jgi:methylmalonyl-CoA mutase